MTLRWNLSHARSCVCHRVTLGHFGMIGLSTSISLVFSKIFMARGRYTKYFLRFKRKISISAKLKLTYACYALSILTMELYALNVFLGHFLTRIDVCGVHKDKMSLLKIYFFFNKEIVKCGHINCWHNTNFFTYGG